MIENNLGKLIGVTPTVNSTTASGNFTLDQHYDRVSKNLWPKWFPTIFSSNPYSVSLFSETGGEVSTITMPSNVDSSMFAVHFDWAFINPSAADPRPLPTNVVPSGWTQIGSAAQNGRGSSRLTISWKKLTSADSGQIITGMTFPTAPPLNGSTRKVIYVFKESSNLDRFTVTANLKSIETQGRGGTALPSGTTNFAGLTKPFIYWIVYASEGTRPSSDRVWTGTTPTFQYVPSYDLMFMNFFIVNSTDTTPIDGTYSLTGTNYTQCLSAGYFTFS